jgi:hypothetical protein
VPKEVRVFLVLAHDRRRILHFGVTACPTAEWTAQQLREAFPWGPPHLFIQTIDVISIASLIILVTSRLADQRQKNVGLYTVGPARRLKIASGLLILQQLTG